MMSPNPRFLHPRFNGIPMSLQLLPWAVWNAEPRVGKPGKFNKAPRCPKTGVLIGTNKPELFGTFEEAKAAYSSGAYTGVGLLLVNNGVVGVDIDNLQGTTTNSPSVEVWVEKAIQEGAYCERSPSGSGLRLFYFDPDFTQGKKVGTLEIYCNLRFLTVTGHAVKSLGEIL